MVKLIELMVVIAIIGILATLVIGPAKHYAESQRVSVSDDRELESNEMMINGVLHVCGDFGECEPVD